MRRMRTRVAAGLSCAVAFSAVTAMAGPADNEAGGGDYNLPDNTVYDGSANSVFRNVDFDGFDIVTGSITDMGSVITQARELCDGSPVTELADGPYQLPDTGSAGDRKDDYVVLQTDVDPSSLGAAETLLPELSADASTQLPGVVGTLTADVYLSRSTTTVTVSGDCSVYDQDKSFTGRCQKKTGITSEIIYDEYYLTAIDTSEASQVLDAGVDTANTILGGGPEIAIMFSQLAGATLVCDRNMWFRGQDGTITNPEAGKDGEPAEVTPIVYGVLDFISYVPPVHVALLYGAGPSGFGSQTNITNACNDMNGVTSKQEQTRALSGIYPPDFEGKKPANLTSCVSYARFTDDTEDKGTKEFPSGNSSSPKGGTFGGVEAGVTTNITNNASIYTTCGGFPCVIKY